jgi:hypothetical protein
MQRSDLNDARDDTRGGLPRLHPAKGVGYRSSAFVYTGRYAKSARAVDRNVRILNLCTAKPLFCASQESSLHRGNAEALLYALLLLRSQRRERPSPYFQRVACMLQLQPVLR